MSPAVALLNPIVFSELVHLAKEIGFHFLEKRAGKPITSFTDEEALAFITRYREEVKNTSTDSILGPPPAEEPN